MDKEQEETMIRRLNIVVQQRNTFLDQLVLLQEQIEVLTKRIKELEDEKEEL